MTSVTSVSVAVFLSIVPSGSNVIGNWSDAPLPNTIPGTKPGRENCEACSPVIAALTSVKFVSDYSEVASEVVFEIEESEEGGFTARLPDIPAYGEGQTEEEAIADLREAIRGSIETFGLDDALQRLNTPTVRELDWDLAELSRG